MQKVIESGRIYVCMIVLCIFKFVYIKQNKMKG